MRSTRSTLAATLAVSAFVVALLGAPVPVNAADTGLIRSW